LTIALLYLLGRMPEADEEAYEIHLLECRSCLTRAEAVEQALRYRGCFQGEIRDMRDLRRKLFPPAGCGGLQPREPEAEVIPHVVIPFHAASSWSAHPGPIRLGSFVRGELSREDNRAVVRHLLTGCPACSAVLRPLLGQADLPLPRTGGR
jgi:hypothetical protein